MSETRDLLARTAALAADYVESLGERPVFPDVTPEQLREALGGPLPDDPVEPEQVIDELVAAAEPGVVALGSGHELVDHLLGLDRVLGQRPAECLAQLLGRHVGEDRSLAEALDVVGRDLGRPAQQLPRIAHGSSANSCASRRPSMMSRSYSSPSLRATFSEAVLPWMISAISRSAPSSPSA